MPVFNNNLAGAAGSGGADAGYKIERSIRLNNDDSAYLNRAVSSNSSRRIWTWSCWIKRSGLADRQEIFAAGNDGTDFFFDSDDKLHFYYYLPGVGYQGWCKTDTVFRDASAWYHIVLVFDSTQSTVSDIVKIYVNSVRQPLTFNNNFTVNDEAHINSNSTHYIGRYSNGDTEYADYYLAEVHFVDGAALAPTYFGEFDSTTGVWNPIDPTFPAVNNGTTWSNDGSSSATLQNGSWSQVFDGTRYMYSGSGSSNGPALDNGSITFAPSGLKGRVVTAGVRGGSNKTYTVNGQSMSFGSGSAEVATIDLGSVQSITSVVGTSTASGTWAQFYWIAVDGMLLTDGAQKHGKNGFHLSYSDYSSNAALGTDSSGNNNTWTVNNLVGTGGTFQTGHTTQSYGGNGTSQSRTGVGFSPDLVWIKSRTLTRSHFWFDTKRGATKFLQCDGAAAQATDATSLTSFDNDGFSVGARSGLNDNNHTFAAWMWDAGGGSYASNTSGTITTSTKQNGKFAITHWDTNAASGTIGTGLSSVDFCILKAVDGNSDWNVWHKNFANTNNTSTRLRLNTANTASQDSDYFAGGGAAGNGKIALGSLGNPNNEMIAYSWKEIAGESKFGYYQGNGTWSQAPQTITCGFKPALVMIKATSVGERWVIFDSVSTGKYLYTSEGVSEITTSKLEILDNGFKVKGSDAEWNDPNHYYVYAAWSAAQVKQTDSFLDSPTNYEANGGNYATLNPLKNGGLTLDNGNLDVSKASANWRLTTGTIGISSGKFYWEYTATTASDNHIVGISDTEPNIQTYIGEFTPGWAYQTNGRKTHNDVFTNTTTANSGGEIIQIAVDMDAGKIWFGIDNTYIDSGNPSAGTNPAYSNVSGTVLPAISLHGTVSGSFNFGQRPFAYTPPTGFKSLCTQNLNDPAIADPSTAFDTALWTGNGSTQNITNLGFSPDLAWIKGRSFAGDHALFDAVRGATKRLRPNQTNAENTDGNTLTAFNSDGFSLGSSSAVNNNTKTFVGWAWDAGASNTSISAGGLNSSVYNQSQTWSNLVTGTLDTVYGNSSATAPFDGDTGSSYSDGIRPTNGNYLSMNFGTTFANATSVKIYGHASLDGVTYSGSEENLKINGTAIGASDWANNGGSAGQSSATFSLSNGLTSLEWGYASGSQSTGYLYLQGIEVDGKLLTNSGVTPPNVPSIASTVRANPTAGFSIVKWTGTSSAATIGHNLNASLGMYIIKNTDDNTAWAVYHKDVGATKKLQLNTADASSTSSFFNSTEPTTSVFSVGGSGTVNNSGDESIAYCWSEVPGFSKFGSYVSNNNTDGPFVFLGFQAKLIVWKNRDANHGWYMYDDERNPNNPMSKYLAVHDNIAEGDPGGVMDVLSNGFKVRNTGSDMNTGSNTIIYMAWAEHPFKTARAR